MAPGTSWCISSVGNLEFSSINCMIRSHWIDLVAEVHFVSPFPIEFAFGPAFEVFAHNWGVVVNPTPKFRDIFANF